MTFALRSTIPPLHEAALRYAARGWHVFPCAPLGKTPVTARGNLEATTDRALIDLWWQRRPNANIGVRTGGCSGIVVLDIDGDEGHDSLRDLERTYRPLPRTATVATPGGGQHIYFRHPGGIVRNSASTLAPRVDVRGDGGYVIAPPSKGPSGREYTPDEQAPITAMPDWLLALIRARSRPVAAPVDPSEWVQIARYGLKEGGRNHGLARYAGHLLAHGLDQRLVLEFVMAANARCRPPLPTHEVQQLVASIHGREMRKPSRARASDTREAA